MKATLTFVPPGGGEQDYLLDFELPGVPQPGDYIVISRPGNQGRTEDFIVRRTWWHLEYPASKPLGAPETAPVHGQVTTLVVECEFALGILSSDDHKRACKMYSARGKDVKELEPSGY